MRLIMKKSVLRFIDKQIDSSSTENKIELQYWQNRIFKTIIYVMIFGAVPMLLLGAITFIMVDQINYAIIEAGLAVVVTQVLTLKKLSITVKKYVVIMTLYFVGIFLLFTVGPNGAGLLTIAFTLILAGVILENDALTVVVVANLVLFVLITIFLYFDMFNATAFYDYKQTWLINMGVTQVAGLGLSALIRSIYKGLEKQACLLRESHEELIKQGDFHNSLIKNIVDVIGIVDYNGVFTYRSTESVQGIDLSSMVEKPNLFSMIHEEDMDRVISQWRILKLAQNHQVAVECRLWVEDAYIPVYMTLVNLVKHPQIKGILVNYHDISVLKEKEKALLKEKDKAEKSALVKDHFLSTMSHEIRTPLNGMIGMLQLLKMTDITKEQAEMIEVSSKASDGLLRIINDVLDFSRLTQDTIVLKEEKFLLNDLIDEVVMMLKPSAIDKDLDLSVYVDPTISGALVGDTSRLRQVLINLISNAVKFTHRGSISVQVNIEKQTESNVFLHWQVKDTGIGISQTFQAEIFESFTQNEEVSKREFTGTGLGLALTKGLVGLMSGDIWVESELGEGSNFHFTTLLKRFYQGKQGSEEDFKGSLPNLNILLAEDDEINKKVVSKLCEKFNWTVEIASNGIEALELYKDHDFDLVLMDVEMPVCNGLEATSMIRNYEIVKQKHVPIIAMTAYGFEKDRKKCLDAGMDDYITKPVDFNQLKRMVIENI